MQDYYALLGIPQFTPDRTVIRSAYLKMARFYHPDITTLPQEVAEERMKLLNSVYETLTDAERKRSYDAALRSELVLSQRRNLPPRTQNAQDAPDGRSNARQYGGFFKRHAAAVVWGMLAVILTAAVILLILLFRHAAGLETAASALALLR